MASRGLLSPGYQHTGAPKIVDLPRAIEAARD
jgi:hypothetical protein